MIKLEQEKLSLKIWSSLQIISPVKQLKFQTNKTL